MPMMMKRMIMPGMIKMIKIGALAFMIIKPKPFFLFHMEPYQSSKNINNNNMMRIKSLYCIVL